MTREEILDQVQTYISGWLAETSLAAGVYRGRREQLPALPSLIIRPVIEESDSQIIGFREAALTVAIDIYARGDIPDQAADPVLQAVVSALEQSPTLGLSEDSNIQVMPQRQVVWSEDAFDDAQVSLRFQITYRNY